MCSLIVQMQKGVRLHVQGRMKLAAWFLIPISGLALVEKNASAGLSSKGPSSYGAQ